MESYLTPEDQQQKIMELAMQAGQLLLSNGAEIYRVEETIRRICKAYGVTAENTFILSNGIFMTGESSPQKSFARVQYIPVSGTHMNKLAAVNALSRQIELGKVTISEALEELERIQNMKGHSLRSRIIAAGIGSAAFCCLFGGSLLENAAAGTSGLIVYSFFVCLAVPHFSKITRNMLGGFLATTICILLHLLGFGDRLGTMIIGSIMPLIPGVAFTNAIREIANEDYISGSVRMLDAILIFFCVASGVGISLSFWGHFIGGIIV